jgi:hypothetical protein
VGSAPRSFGRRSTPADGSGQTRNDRRLLEERRLLYAGAVPCVEAARALRCVCGRPLHYRGIEEAARATLGSQRGTELALTQSDCAECWLSAMTKKSDFTRPSAIESGMDSPTRIRCSSSHTPIPAVVRSVASCRMSGLSNELWDRNAMRCFSSVLWRSSFAASADSSRSS